MTNVCVLIITAFLVCVLSKPSVYGSINLICAALHLIILAIFISPYIHCESSTVFRQNELILYEKLQCSGFNETIVDNAVIFSKKFDLLRVAYAWLLLDACMIIASILLLYGVLFKMKFCAPNIFSIPFIVVCDVTIIVDIFFLIIWLVAYKNHFSKLYFHQIVGIRDRVSVAILKHIMKDEDVANGIVTVTDIKTVNIFFRLLYHIWTFCCTCFAVNRYFMKWPEIEEKQTMHPTEQ
ncbi:uncharacterized protein [Atheta coriaria]|uniref:uncharacterized protein n=1 Tax=Dalotia coriaria TaxID=877792 RepID=UPI0031F3BBEF